MMIKNAKQKLLALATALTLTLTMAGCTAQSTQKTESAEPQQTQEVQQTENAAGGTENVEIPDAAEEVAVFDPEYSDRDKSGAWDESEAVSIALSDGGSTISGEGAEVSGNVVTVIQAGVYVLSGLLSNGRIVVEAGDEDKVQVVLSGASITSSDGPAIWVKSADKVFLTLAEGTGGRRNLCRRGRCKRLRLGGMRPDDQRQRQAEGTGQRQARHFQQG